MKRFTTILILLTVLMQTAFADNELDSLYNRFTECSRKGYIKQANKIMAIMGDDCQFTSEISFQEANATLLDKYVNWYYSRGDFAGRLPYLKRVLYFYTDLNDSMNMARAYHTLGATYQMLGIYDRAIESYNQSSDILNAIGGDSSHLRYRYTLNNIAALYFEQNEFDKCEALYRKCLSLINDMEDEIRNEIDRSTYLGNIAMVYNARAEEETSGRSRQDYLDSALFYSREATEIAKRYCEGKDNEVEIVKREVTLARALMLNGALPEAGKVLDECDAYIVRNGLEYQKIQVVGIRAEIDALNGDRSGAESRYLEVCNYAHQMGLREMEGQTLEKLYELLKDTAPAKALEHFAARAAIKDSIFTLRQNALISDFEVQYKTKEKESLVRQVNAKVRQGRLLSLSLTIILILCIATVIAINRFRLEAKKQNALLKEANEAKDKMMSIISHDLKNPALAQRNALRSLTSTFRTLDGVTLDACLKELASTSESQVLLLSNLLDWARLQSGRISCNKTVASLSAIIATELRTVRKMLDDKGLTVRTELCANDEVAADRTMTAIIFRNLITNAVKFSAPGSTIRVVTGIEGDTVSCSVIDHGRGMDEQKARTLFTEAISHVPADEAGTGLGLELCRDFIRMNGGTIKAESSIGEGSTFTFHLNRP